MSPIEYSSVVASLAGVGLAGRGAFAADGSENVPDLSDGPPAAALLLIGNVGTAMWQRFCESAEFADRQPDPLDRWSRRVLNEVAGEFGGPGVCETLYPFGGPPYLPFQQWAQKAEAVFPSPTGPLIHAEFGLWHAYRGALIFSRPISLPPAEADANPCLSCFDQPCLSTCPVEAFTAEGYDVPSCVGHLSSAEGADCNSRGCQARRACPIGQAYTYTPPQAAFHTRAFLKARLASTSRVSS